MKFSSRKTNINFKETTCWGLRNFELGRAEPSAVWVLNHVSGKEPFFFHEDMALRQLYKTFLLGGKTNSNT